MSLRGLRCTVYQPKFDHLRYEVTSSQLAFSALSKLTRELVAPSFSTPKITQTRRPARRCGTQVSYFKPLWAKSILTSMPRWMLKFTVTRWNKYLKLATKWIKIMTPELHGCGTEFIFQHLFLDTKS